MPCVMDEPDFGGDRRKTVRQLDVKLDEFEAVNSGAWADKIGVESEHIAVIQDNKVSTLVSPPGFHLELRKLSA